MPYGHRARRLVTCDPARASEEDPTGVVEDAAIVVDGARIAYAGSLADAPSQVEWREALELVTPGLVDAHTHACWAGSRHHEYAVRMAGGDYRDIARAGGGIVATHRAVAAASEDALADALAARLARMAALGVTTVEVKSGYGLLPEHEEKQLRAIARAASLEGPRVVATFLALHALPPAVERAAYVEQVAKTVVPRVAAEKLAAFVDAYVDENAFRVDEARGVFEAARAAGLGVRAHVGQFADVGGAELAAEMRAASADHLEHLSERGARALGSAGTCAVLLPVASFTLGQPPPNLALLREAGVEMVVASDANPGTAPTESLPLAMALAVRLYRLTPAEALLGSTRNAARALGLADVGVLRSGAAADFVGWDLPHEEALVQPWGTPRAARVVRGGVRLA